MLKTEADLRVLTVALTSCTPSDLHNILGFQAQPLTGLVALKRCDL